MRTITTILEQNTRLPENFVLFDIETTGLSAKTSYVYLIGALSCQEHSLVRTQWFCDDFSEEKELLKTFFSFLSNQIFTLVHYNGCGFDIPFLNRKFSRYCLSFQIEPDSTIDLYRLLLPFKDFLSLPDFRQKTLEKCCGFERTDTFEGSDLITLYAAYTGKYRLATLTGKTEEADALLSVLLLHNSDDLSGLFALYQHTRIPVLSAVALHPSYITQEKGALVLSYDCPILPFCLQIHFPFGSLLCTNSMAQISIPLFHGELKYFFSNYKDYSYLVYEDMAVHNSLAGFVDKSAKQKCRPHTAYQKKTGTFLPLPPALKPEELLPLTPEQPVRLFYQEYKSSPAYLELPEQFLEQLSGQSSDSVQLSEQISGQSSDSVQLSEQISGQSSNSVQLSGQSSGSAQFSGQCSGRSSNSVQFSGQCSGQCSGQSFEHPGTENTNLLSVWTAAFFASLKKQKHTG